MLEEMFDIFNIYQIILFFLIPVIFVIGILFYFLYPNWANGRLIKRFIENPDSMRIANPRFCDHEFIDNICSNCGIKKEIKI
jgi:hypothetical protein